ncbi:MAG: tyrosine-type recombinase/integrase [Firmicutes bacterium]|uniref:Tyrosine-type recombinase/integrase n=1 Tax=Candidatus Onthovivens merdipullorum TaxID=2840889 RepID=A0A9D9DIC0_9BACL|nr:tyrosine-type recombinase/integrase [Candidatus Onthovivens merdipullorum]
MPVYLNKKNNKWYISHRLNGKQFTIRRDKNNNPFNTKKEAQDYENEFFILSSSSFLKDMNKRIRELKQLITKEINNKYKITSSYSINIYLNKYFIPFFGNFRLSNLNNDLLILYKNKILNIKDKNISISNILRYSKKIFRIICKFYNLSINLNILDYQNKNLTNNKSFKYYDYEQFKTFISVIKDPCDKLMFQFLYYYGLRVGELRAVTSNSVDLHLNQLHILNEASTKAGVGKTIIVNPKTQSSIRSYPLLGFLKEEYLIIYKENYSGYLFKGVSSEIISLTTIYRKNEAYAKLAGLPKIRIHDFRHSCAIFLYSNGFDSASIAKWLGHSSTAVTEQTYIHYRSNIKDKIKDFIEENNVMKK